MADLERVNRALDGVDLAAPSTTKFNRLETVLASLASIPATHVVAATISKAGNFTVRAAQSKRAQTAQLFVGVVTDAAELAATQKAAITHVKAGRAPAVLLLLKGQPGAFSAPWAVQSSGRGPSILNGLPASLGSETLTVTTPSEGDDADASSSAIASLPSVIPMQRLVLDPRIRRMFRTAVASRPAVMLVGPPGTGKSQLITELFDEMVEDPAIVGMSSAHELYMTTPDESWTVRELVGGDTVDDKGRLRFSPGAVLESITQDRWLVLDEANRADMDKIFGGLLTWLSGQSVTVGRISGDPGAGPVRLGWSETPECVVTGLDAMRADEPGGDPVDFLAGTEWRLLGTYNALDAQRVFRFGLALGRRFAHVPVPSPDAAGFKVALVPRLINVPIEVRSDVESRILALYEAHHRMESASLGPAVFLAMPSYIAAGFPSGTDLLELVAEAYLTSVGTWLSRLEEDQLDALGAVMATSGALGEQWDWVRSQLDSLR